MTANPSHAALAKNRPEGAFVDPERIRAHNPADLYVSMTRATQRLGLLHVER